MISSSFDCKVNYPDIPVVRMDMPQLRSDEVSTTTCSVGLNPIFVGEKQVDFNMQIMEIGKWYPFSHNSKEYLAVKVSNKTVDIYRVKK
jgi:hypothetical protein